MLPRLAADKNRHPLAAHGGDNGNCYISPVVAAAAMSAAVAIAVNCVSHSSHHIPPQRCRQNIDTILLLLLMIIQIMMTT